MIPSAPVGAEDQTAGPPDPSITTAALTPVVSSSLGICAVPVKKTAAAVVVEDLGICPASVNSTTVFVDAGRGISMTRLPYNSSLLTLLSKGNLSISLSDVGTCGLLVKSAFPCGVNVSSDLVQHGLLAVKQDVAPPNTSVAPLSFWLAQDISKVHSISANSRMVVATCCMASRNHSSSRSEEDLAAAYSSAQVQSSPVCAVVNSTVPANRHRQQSATSCWLAPPYVA